MRTLLLLLLLLLLPAAVAGEEPKRPINPVEELPTCLRPGITAVYDRAGGASRLPGTVTFRTLAGEEKGTVQLERTYDTGERGVLSERDRLIAVLDAATRTIVGFSYSVGRKKDEPLILASRLVREPDRDKKPALFHERLTYPGKDEKPRVKRNRLKLDGAWAPDLLEPFLVPLLGVTGKEKKTLSVVSVLTGSVGKVAAAYASFGEGKMRLGEESVECLILHRTRGDGRDMLYLRATDSLPLKAPSAWITLRPAKKPAKEKK